jgi:hypothetical protein
MTDLFKTYIHTLQTDLARGNASEHTHRPALKTLLESMGERLTATNEPRQVTDCGKPDMAIYRGPVLLGYLETKDVGINLDAEERGPQLKRYRDALPNLILTDYLEFRWYVKGERRVKIALGRLEPGGKIKIQKEDVAAVRELLTQFLAHQAPSIGTAQDLALSMAGLARLIQEAASATLVRETQTGTLKGLMDAFEKTLLPALTVEEFTDMYAQTLTYGLFAAKVTMGAGQDLRRDTAAGLLPETNPFLKKLFYHLAGPEVPATVSWVIDDMVALLNAADLEAVLADFGKGSLEKDPVVHFYETFLTAYDPEKRKLRGVYYTPEPVVSYIVRAIDYLLKERFGRPWGLADQNTLVLDPACGTGTFLHSVIALIYETLTSQGQVGAWKSYVTAHLLPRVFGFELLMAPYAVAHLKLGFLLKERGFDFPPGQRLGVYLTNTLEVSAKETPPLPFAGFITEESNNAERLKNVEPIEVVLGNPPYAGHSANASFSHVRNPKTGKLKMVFTWIGRLMEDYKKVDGRPLGEKNPKWLQDDYVKFLRWGHWRINETGKGILAMITNHGYLDNPTFRGMRRALMQTFNEIYVLNLHGNAKKKEVCPDGSADKNVFDIQQGVAIGIFVKRPGDSGEARIYHADLWGLREGKYQTLAEMEVESTPWQELQPTAPFYLFVPQVLDLRTEYERGWPVPKIFPVNSVGIVTARDNLTIHWTRQEVMETVKDFTQLDPETAREKYHLGKDVRDWKVELAQKDLRTSGLNEKLITPVLYRPFDIRFSYYTGQTRGFICMPRPEVMGHMLAGKNLGLIATRQTRDEWAVLSTRFIMGHKSLAAFDINTLFPLYHYHTVLGQVDRTSNIAPAFIQDLSGKVGLAFLPEGRGDLASTMGPEDIFFYSYAVFHSPTYRERYVEFLKGDFPRLPLTGNKALFASLVGLGAELTALHLMESAALGELITSFPVSGSNGVAKVDYDEPTCRVYINADQYFEGVHPEVWVFQVGGYQVLHKWLKDRKGRTLSFEDLHHYQKIVVALAETIRLMGEIDSIIDARGGWPIDREP